MCGILGFFSSAADAQVAPRMKEALRLLKHRGPDDSGLTQLPGGQGWVWLGHTRLSVIDLSAAGHQPMPSPDGRYAIVFNGEIYNYRELRTELVARGARFKSGSDTEVLLAAWQAWGRDCLARLDGMFAFVVYDRESQTLTCVRDAFGIKPFFYSQCEGSFGFASEVPSLIALRGSKARVNWQRAYDYLVHGEYDARAETMVDGIRHLLPGHMLTFSIGSEPKVAIERWWSPQIVQSPDLEFSEAASLVRQHFLRSVELNLRSDVALGAALSGGIDSSAIVCAMRHLAPDMPIHTFSFVASGHQTNEEPWIDIVNSHVGAQVHKVHVTPEELMGDLDDLLLAQGEPFGSLSIYAQYRVYQKARECGVTVTLDGQGADEVLGGYQGFPGERVHSLIDERQWLQACQFLDQWRRWPGRSLSLGLRSVISELGGDAVRAMLGSLTGLDRPPEWIDADVATDMGLQFKFQRFRSSAGTAGRRLIAQEVNMLTSHGLPALLRHGDRNSMHFAVESRVPFLSLQFVDLMLGMPERFLVSDEGRTKHLFRVAMDGIVPPEILNRKDKIGFEPPEKHLILSIAKDIKQLLREDIGIPFLRSQVLSRHFDEIVSGVRPFSWQAWRWVNFYKWKLMLVS
jgi:asparagine synthase (glutamine-hydrolysing)